MERGREHDDRVVGEGASSGSLTFCLRQAWFRRQANHSRVSPSFGESDEGIALRSHERWVQYEKVLRAVLREHWALSLLFRSEVRQRRKAAATSHDGELHTANSRRVYGVTVTALPGKRQECRHCKIHGFATPLYPERTLECLLSFNFLAAVSFLFYIEYLLGYADLNPIQP
jgi:hypothetical protein